MRLVGDRKVALVHLADTPARNGATKTGLVGHQLFFAIGRAWGCHRLCRNVFGAFKLVVPVVAGRQSADLVDHVHQHLRSVGGQALACHAVFRQDFLLLGGGFHECFGVKNIANAFGSTNSNGFQVFAAHDGAHARASGSTM